MNGIPAKRMPLSLAILAGVSALAGMAVLAAADVQFGIAFQGAIGFPAVLVACWWLRSRRFLWTLTVLGIVLTVAIGMYEPTDARAWTHRLFAAAVLLLTACIFHRLIGSWRQIEQAAADLSSANRELAQRQRSLESLLRLARALSAELARPDTLDRICQALGEMLNDPNLGVGVKLLEGDKLRLICHYGFGPGGPSSDLLPYPSSFARLIIERNHSDVLEDIDGREDLVVPQPRQGERFRSILAAPLRVNGKPMGILEVYSRRQRTWSDEQIGMVESLASQTSISLQAAELFEHIEQQRRAAEEASIRKSRFLAQVSHDIRNPVNAINLLAELLHRAASEPAMAKEVPNIANDIRKNTLALVDLVSDVLDLTRFDAARIDLEETEFSLTEMLSDECHRYQSVAAEKGLEFGFQPPELPLLIRADRVKLSRVMGNLLGNAIKFTPQGSVRVSVGVQEGNGGPGAWVRVTDTGPGIAAEFHERIFDEFFQLRHNDDNRGTGLGLAICKRLVNAMGGSIGVESEPGKGSSFILRLPATAMAAR